MSNKNVNSKNKAYPYIRNITALFLCIVINLAGRQLSATYELPGWFDTYGTFISSYTMGPVPGAIVGASGNLIISFWKPNAFAYSLVSIFLAVSVGYMARKKYFNTVFHTMTVAGATAVGSTIISSVLNIVLNKCSTNNIWGNGVRDYLTGIGLGKIPSTIIGEFYLEFPDKLLAAMLMYIIIRIARSISKNRKSDVLKKSSAAAIAFFLIIGIGALPVYTSAEPAKEVNTDKNIPISYIQTIYNSENGLNCGHANDIAQTNDGILWIGTYAGLYRYNGTEFVLRNDFDAVRNVNCLYVDREGRLWIGTNDNGLVVVINNEVTNVLTSDDGLPSDSIRSIVQSADGEYYIGTSDGIITLELKMGITMKAVIPEVGYVSRLSADENGHVSAINAEGCIFVLEDNKILASLDPKTEGVNFSSCSFDSKGTLYVGTVDAEVIEYRFFKHSLVSFRKTYCPQLSKINCIYPEINNQTWICSDNGIGYIDSDNRFMKQESGDFNHSVEKMTLDYQGNLWFASSRLGLLRLSRSTFTDVFADTGLDSSVVNTTAMYKNNLYIGTDDGLKIVDINNRNPFENDLTKLFEGKRIRCLMTDSENNLWICSYGIGLVCLDKYGIIHELYKDHSELGQRARTCYEMKDGTIAVSTSNGVFFIKNYKIESSIPYGDEFGYATVLCFLQNDDGTLYAGTDGNGIAVIRNGRMDSSVTRDDGLTSGVVMRMVRDPEDNSVYIVTSNSICRLADNKLKQLKDFPYTNNYDLFIDDDGELFVLGSSGIYVVDKNALINGKLNSNYMILDSRRGLVGALTANAWCGQDKDKNVFLCADRGVYMMNLDGYTIKQRPYRLTVSSVRVDDKLREIDRSLPLTVNRDVTKIEFVPEIINYTHDDPIVSYYLEGFESSWTNVRQSELLSVSYTNLEPGDYTFHLAIRDENGKLLEENTYRLNKETAIYDYSWFRYYLIGVAVVFIGWLTWFITRTQMQHTIQIQQARLKMALQQLQMGNETILAIAKTVDAKDVRTSKHSQRVSEYSAMIAKEYGFTKAEQDNIRNAALLHDIGKIGIPDKVLNKDSRLTDEEYALMKTHVTKGADILKDFTLIDHVVEGARYHHERYDGKGYPDGLKGEEIPLYGRIISIADAFDAMTANRVYRKRQDFDYVMSELHKGRGTQFDPELLDIFLRLIDMKKIDIDALYKETNEQEEE